MRLPESELYVSIWMLLKILRLEKSTRNPSWTSEKFQNTIRYHKQAARPCKTARSWVAPPSWLTPTSQDFRAWIQMTHFKGLVHRVYTMFTSFRAKSGMAQWIHHVSICASLGCDYDHSNIFLVPTPPFSLCFSSLFVFSRWQLVTCDQLSPTVTPNKIRWWHFFS